MPGKKRPATWNYSASAKRAYKKRYASAKSSGRTGLAGILRASVRRANAGVKRLNSMIETKESTQVTGSNLSLPHNKLYDTGINVFSVNIGTGDPMSGTGQRIGDKISVRGLLIKGMFENSLARPKVNYRVMLIRCAKGDTPTVDTLFKGIVGNKLIDQINTERFTLVATKKFTINTSNGATLSVDAAGQPIEVFNGTTLQYGGVGTKVWNMWIPGKKFGKYGTITYENQSTTQVKFFDYKLMVMTYDWFGTPSGLATNNVGKINEMYTKVYYKDA